MTLTGEGDEWTHTFTDLPVYKDGQKKLSTQWQKTRWTITPPLMELRLPIPTNQVRQACCKNWKDANNQDSYVKNNQVQLYAGDQKVV